MPKRPNWQNGDLSALAFDDDDSDPVRVATANAAPANGAGPDKPLDHPGITVPG